MDGDGGAPGPRERDKVEFAAFLRDHEQEIVTQWSHDLRAGAYASYGDRPLDELESSCRQCFAGYLSVIGEGDHTRIRRFVQREVRARVGQGFRASEIARELSSFKLVVWPLLVERYIDRPRRLVDALGRIRSCVDQALFELADEYQMATQQQMEAYVEEMEAMNRRLEELSVRDPLTGLYNRRYFQDRLTHEFARAKRHDRPLAFLMVDIDHFKRINDTHGHQAGDQVLRGIALLMVGQTRSTDIVARYGGEEFAAVLPETPAEGAMVAAEKLREAVAVAPLYRTGGEDPDAALSAAAETVFCTISVGVAAYDAGQMPEPAQLVHAADKALYEAKNAGRNRAVAAWTVRTP